MLLGIFLLCLAECGAPILKVASWPSIATGDPTITARGRERGEKALISSFMSILKELYRWLTQ